MKRVLFYARQVLAVACCLNIPLVALFILPIFVGATCPEPTCLNGLVVSLSPVPEGGCASLIYAEDFVTQLPDVACAGQVTYAIYAEDEVAIDSINFTPSPIDSSLLLTHCDPAVLIVRIYGIDENGDYAYCTVYLLVQDGTDCNLEGYSSGLAGVIATEEDERVAGALVRLTANDLIQEELTAQDGSYFFQHLGCDTLFPTLIEVQKNDDLLNGVSTFDLTLLTRHILGILPLDSPYRLLAADINNSGHISILDVIHLRKAILGVNDHFPNNTSWRFVPEVYDFPDPQQPWSVPSPTSISIAIFPVDAQSLNFVAVKVGDVNHSVLAN